MRNVPQTVLIVRLGEDMHHSEGSPFLDHNGPKPRVAIRKDIRTHIGEHRG